MNYSLSITLISILAFCHIAIAQKPEYIHFDLGTNMPSRSIFSKMEVMDTRFDTVYLGFVQKGAFNRRAPIKLGSSMEQELARAVSAYLNGSIKENGTVLINIRNFFVSEFTGAMSETGTFIFKAGCYLKEGDGYRFMFSIDTTLVVRAMDVTQKLLRTVNGELENFIREAATFNHSRLYSNNYYSLYDVQHIDETEKKLLPVYNINLPDKGLYASFDDFKNNRPTETSFIKEVNKKTQQPEFFRIKEDGSKGKQILLYSYYAVCDGEQLYISTAYGLYQATKKELDFYFIGKGKENANASAVSAAAFMFGLLGGLMASVPETATFEFRIDHTNGKFLPLRRITD